MCKVYCVVCMANMISPNLSKESVVSQYRAEIDGLRALAVVAVIINHFSKSVLPSGFLGVDIFFVISGYVITTSLVNKKYTSIQNFLLGFYARRIKRIMPALIVCVVITCIIGFLFVPPLASEFVSSWRGGIAALFGMSNLYFFNQANDYFSPSTELNLFTQTWSLGVEEQFYLIFPFLLWTIGLTEKSKNRKNTFILLMTCLSFISLCTYLYLKNISQPATYFLMPARFWELAAGCWTLLVLEGKNQLSKLVAYIKPFPIFVAIVALFFAPQSAIYQSTPTVVVLTSVLIATLNSGTSIQKLFTKQPIVSIGLISYSLYLWHWSVLAISRWTIGIEWWTVPIQICLIFLLALVSNKYIEQPLRHANWSPSRLLTIGYGSIAALFSAILLAGIGMPLKNLLYIGDPAPFSQANWWRDADGKYTEKCHVEKQYSDRIFNECIDRDRQPELKNTVYLFGDSHARNYLKGIKKALPEYNINYVTMGSRCTFMSESDISSELEFQTLCSSYVKRVREFVKTNIKQGDLVLVGQEKTHQSDRGYLDNMLDLARHTQQTGGKFILLADLPSLNTDPGVCVKQPWRSHPPAICRKSLSEVNDEQKKLNEMGKLLESQVLGATYLDVRNSLCIDLVCFPSKKWY
jgi:peptidoglycan/LPS O-acetylase OafA/YrhL